MNITFFLVQYYLLIYTTRTYYKSEKDGGCEMGGTSWVAYVDSWVR